LDAVDGAAQQKRLEVQVNGRFDQVGALGEGGAAVAVKTILVGDDLDHVQARALGRAFDDLNILDLWHGHAARGAGRCLLSLRFLGGQQGGRRGTGHGGAEKFTSVHKSSLRYRLDYCWLAATVWW